MKLDGTMNIMVWLVAYASTLYRLCHLGAPHDGRTPYHRLTGKAWRIALPPFGEQVEYRHRVGDKFTQRWEEGTYIGLKRTHGRESCRVESRRQIVCRSIDSTNGSVCEMGRRGAQADRWHALAAQPSDGDATTSLASGSPTRRRPRGTARCTCNTRRRQEGAKSLYHENAPSKVRLYG